MGGGGGHKEAEAKLLGFADGCASQRSGYSSGVGCNVPPC